MTKRKRIPSRWRHALKGKPLTPEAKDEVRKDKLLASGWKREKEYDALMNTAHFPKNQSGCMISKYDSGEHKFVPVTKKATVKSVSLDAARTWMHSGAVIHQPDSVHRFIVYNGRVVASITNAILFPLLQSGTIIRQRVPGSHEIRYVKASA